MRLFFIACFASKTQGIRCAHKERATHERLKVSDTRTAFLLRSVGVAAPYKLSERSE